MLFTVSYFSIVEFFQDVMKLTKQVGFCYSANRRADNVCGVHGQMKQRLESIGDYKNWDVSLKDLDTSINTHVIHHSKSGKNIIVWNFLRRTVN